MVQGFRRQDDPYLDVGWTDILPPSPFAYPASATTTQTFAFQPRHRAVVLAIQNVAAVTALTVKGTGSGITYATTAAVPAAGLILIPVLFAFDDHIDVQLTVSAAGPVQVACVGITETFNAPNVLQLTGGDVTLGGVSAPAALSDADANPTTYRFGAALELFGGGATWVRVYQVSSLGDGGGGQNTVPTGLYLFTGAGFDRTRTPAVFKTALVSAAGNTAVWTPAGGKRFRLMGYSFAALASATAAAPAELAVTLNDSGTALGIGWDTFVSAAALATEAATPASGPVQLGNGALSAVANNVLQANLSFALTAGAIRVNVWGTEE